MAGEELIEMMLSQVDIPRDLIERELRDWMATSGVTSEELSLEQLRKIMVIYLQETLPKIQEAYQEGVELGE